LNGEEILFNWRLRSSRRADCWQKGNLHELGAFA
jgi:hypothetical protein